MLAEVGVKWNHILEFSYLHMNALGDRVCDVPTDGLHTAVLWKNAAQWAKMKQLVNFHINCVLRLDCTFSEIMWWTKRDQGNPPMLTLELVLKQFEGIEKSISDDLIVRTDRLSDLARLSLHHTMRSLLRLTLNLCI